MGLRSSSGVWAAPVAWTLLAAVAVRAGRLDPAPALAAALVALLGVGLGRALAGHRGSLAGRAAELVLVGGGVAWLLAEPATHRIVAGGAAAALAAALALAGAWWGASATVERRLAAVAGAAAGALVLPGLAGAPAWPLKAIAIVAAAAATAALLARVTRPSLAAAGTVAVAASLGPAHTLAWLLPLATAAALVALARGWVPLAAAMALLAALLPPAGLVVGAGLLVASSRRSRAPALLLLLPVAAALAWWRSPLPPSALTTPSMAGLVAAFPLSLTALPLLLPAAALGLMSRRSAPGEGRDALAVGLVLLPWLGRGDWATAAAAALWLGALPAATADPRSDRILAATLPWTVGASVALLLLAPWGALAVPTVSPLLLAAGWAAAAALALVPHPVTALAWLLPLAGLAWTVPVEGGDLALPAGGRLELPAPPGAGWALLVGAPTDAAPGTPLLLGEGPDEAPVVTASPRHPLWLPGRLGRDGAATRRSVTLRHDSEGRTLIAALPVTVRWEPLERWRARRTRLLGLLGGALLLLLAALLLPRPPPLAAGAAAALLLGGLAAAGSAVEPLARAGFRDAADLATAVWLAAAAIWLPRLAARRLVAGVLLLAPLALAQPLLRHPAGDEVYQLELLASLTTDHDLDISNQIDRGNPAERIYLPYGATLIHSPTLALTLLPGYLVLGWPGALLLTALMVAGGAALTARRAEATGATRRRAQVAWLLVLLTYPAVTFATQLWPAAAGILLVALALAAAAKSRLLAAALAAAAGILVKVRLGLVLLPVAAAAALRRRRLTTLLLATTAVLVALAGVALVMGAPLGRHSLRELLPRAPAATFRGLWGLAWDAGGGLAFAAPLWLVSLAALPAVWRRGGAGERALMVGSALTLAVLAPRSEWFGGGSPPARYLVPLLPLALLAVAELLRRPPGRRLVRLVLPFAAVTAWVAATRPLWLFNGGDGGWWLGDGLAQALDAAARRAFPSLIRPDLAALTVPLVLVASAWWWMRRPHRGAAGVTLAGLAAVVVFVAGVAEPIVHLEDPQITHRGGHAEPPSGTPGRASMTVGWRLSAGAEAIVPWDPPLGHDLAARVRVAGPPGTGGTLTSWWGDLPPAWRPVHGGAWHLVPLARPASLGRGRLHLRFVPDRGHPSVALVVDRVEAVP